MSFYDKLSNWAKQSISLRLITIGILILFLLIPVSMVEDLIRERKYTRESAAEEVSQVWGQEQTMKAVVLTVPYYTYKKVYENEDQKKQYSLVKTIEYAHFLPEQLSVKGEVLPEIRYRGIYEVIVYRTKMNIKGMFNAPSFSDWDIRPDDILWKEAFVSLGLTDLRTIKNQVMLNMNNKAYSFNPGLPSKDVIATGVSTKVDVETVDSAATLPFSIDMEFNGSLGMHFIPLGKQTTVDLNSTWANPSFTGAFLPEQRNITAEGFTASWKVFHLNRPYPQKFLGSTEGIHQSSFGVSLLMPVDEYQKSTRSAKYAVMFITLTFLIFFFAQVLQNISIHPVQYLMVGLALCVFYTLLIALSEHIPFGWSYLIASVAIIAQIALYAHAVFKKMEFSRWLALILVVLYGFIYCIVQLQDYALLMGSIGLFIALATVMYLSRKIDWYNVSKN